MCRRGKFSLLPNHQVADEELSTYHDPGYSSRNMPYSPFKAFMERHKKTKTGLLLVVLLGTAFAFTVGVFTPAISGNIASLWTILYCTFVNIYMLSCSTCC